MKIYYRKDLKAKAQWLRNNATLGEALLWNQLKGKQLLGYDFHRQKPILNYIVDFYCSKLKLIIEIDGISHDFKMEYDEKRMNELNYLGLTVLRFQESEVRRDIENVIQRIVDWVTTQASTHPGA